LTDASGVLTSETVTTEIQATAPALAIGPTGEIRIAYATALDPGVYVATRTASGWSSTRVADAVTDTMSHTIDSQGASHVVWGVFDGSDLTGGIGYATGSGATWSTRMLTAVPGDIDPDVAIGSDGSIHVVFSRRGGTRPQLSEVIVTPRHLRVSRLVRADTSTPDVAFDATGAEHIAYNNMSRSSLHYRTNASGHWVETEIDYGGGGVGLSLTAAGEPWITHNRFDGLVAAHD
jgi:hypothetical protein